MTINYAGVPEGIVLNARYIIFEMLQCMLINFNLRQFRNLVCRFGINRGNTVYIRYRTSITRFVLPRAVLNNAM